MTKANVAAGILALNPQLTQAQANKVAAEVAKLDPVKAIADDWPEAQRKAHLRFIGHMTRLIVRNAAPGAEE